MRPYVFIGAFTVSTVLFIPITGASNIGKWYFCNCISNVGMIYTLVDVPAMGLMVLQHIMGKKDIYCLFV